MLSTVWGAKRRKTGPMPLYRPSTPSAWHTFSMQSEKPWYRRPWKREEKDAFLNCSYSALSHPSELFSCRSRDLIQIKKKLLTLWDSSTGWLYRRVLMTSKGVMVMATATPLIMAATRAMSQLFGPSHWTETHSPLTVFPLEIQIQLNCTRYREKTTKCRLCLTRRVHRSFRGCSHTCKYSMVDVKINMCVNI